MKLVEDEAFERALLDSAAQDAPPRGAARLAAARFAADAAARTPLAPASHRDLAGRLAKGLSVGALAGGALMAAYWAGRADAPLPPVPAPSLREPSKHIPVVPAPSALATVEPPPVVTTPRVSSHRPPLAPPRSVASPSVAEEVARLDATRTALAIGDFDAVARELARYEADFPRGALAREAEFVAISALTEKGDRAGAMRRARRFLALHPKDVHAERVKQLLFWQAEPKDER